MHILLIFSGFIIALVLLYEYRIRLIYKGRNKNKVHFYVARDKDGNLWLYMGKPNRGVNEFKPASNEYCAVLTDNNFEVFGLNKNDYKNLHWKDEPVEISVNIED